MNKNITFEELVKMVELKKKAKTYYGESSDSYCGAFTNRNDVLRVGDVLSNRHNESYYVIIDFQTDGNHGNLRGYGIDITLDGCGGIETGPVTWFIPNEDYVSRKLGFDVTEFKKFIINNSKKEKISKLENQVKDINNEIKKLKSELI